MPLLEKLDIIIPSEQLPLTLIRRRPLLTMRHTPERRRHKFAPEKSGKSPGFQPLI